MNQRECEESATKSLAQVVPLANLSYKGVNSVTSPGTLTGTEISEYMFVINVEST